MDKVGVFLCTGCGIGDALDVDSVIEAADEVGCACTLTHECLCAPEGLDAITGAISENDLNGILVAACSERAKTSEFAGLTTDGPSMFRVALARALHLVAQHGEDDEDTNMLAQDMVRMGLARLDGVKAITPLAEEISETVHGCRQRSRRSRRRLTAAGLDHPVVLVEKDDEARRPPRPPEVDRRPKNRRTTHPQPNPVPKLIEEIKATTTSRS